MSTINSMLSGAQSLFNSYYNNSNNSKSQDSISKLWSAYGSYESNANSALSGLSMISSNVSSLVKSYDDTKNTFMNLTKRSAH